MKLTEEKIKKILNRVLNQKPVNEKSRLIRVVDWGGLEEFDKQMKEQGNLYLKNELK